MPSKIKIYLTFIIGLFFSLNITADEPFDDNPQYTFSLRGNEEAPSGLFIKTFIFQIRAEEKINFPNLYPDYGNRLALFYLTGGKDLVIEINYERLNFKGINGRNPKRVTLFYQMDNDETKNLEMELEYSREEFYQAKTRLSLPSNIKKSLKIWFLYEDLEGKRVEDKYQGKPYFFTVLEEKCDNWLNMFAPSESNSWQSPNLKYSLKAGTVLCVNYSVKRAYALGAHSVGKYGFTIHPAGSPEYILRDRWGNKLMQASSSKLIILPSNVSSMQLWFYIQSYGIFQYWDSNYGKDYWLNLIESR